MKKQLLLFSALILGFSAFSQIPNYVPTNGLVSWWPFNGNGNDESGNGNNLTANGNVQFSNDRFLNPGQAIYLSGQDQYLNKYNPNLPSGNTNRSVSVWYKITATGIDGPTVFAQWDGVYSGTCFTEFSLFADQDVGYLHGRCEDKAWYFPLDNQWIHLVIVYEGNYIKMYKNGQLINDIANPGYYVFSNDLNTSTFEFRVGHPGASYTWPSQYIGYIDDLAYWNRVLTVCEIQDLYNAQLNSVEVNGGLDQTLCEGQTTTLYGTGASTYSWNNGVQNGVGFVPTSSSNYTVIGTDANGCIGTDTVSIVVNNNSSSTLNESTLDSYTLNGQTYTQSGTYTQVIPNAAGCDSTITLNLSLDFTSLNEIQTGFTIAPNPTIDVVTITSTDAMYDDYVIFNQQGRKVLSGTLTGTTTQLDLSRLSRGNYLLQIGERETPIKLVKQ